MSNHPNRGRGFVMTTPGYLRVARELREAADKIERLCRPQTPQERRALTLALRGANQAAVRANRRHNGWDLTCGTCGAAMENPNDE